MDRESYKDKFLVYVHIQTKAEVQIQRIQTRKGHNHDLQTFYRFKGHDSDW